jgi:hypothetical protein
MVHGKITKKNEVGNLVDKLGISIQASFCPNLGFESMHPCVQAWDLNPGLILSKLGI